MKQKALAVMLVLGLSAGTASAQFGFGGVVYDPTNYHNALLRYFQLQQQLIQLVRQGLRLGQIGDPDRPPRRLVLIGGTDAPARGPNPAVPPRSLPRPVQRRMHRQDQRRIFGDPQ